MFRMICASTFEELHVYHEIRKAMHECGLSEGSAHTSNGPNCSFFFGLSLIWIALRTTRKLLLYETLGMGR